MFIELRSVYGGPGPPLLNTVHCTGKPAHLDYWTQGKSLDELKDHLRDL